MIAESDIAIRVENISKRYRIGAKQERYKTLRDTLVSAATNPLRRVRSIVSRSGGEISATTNTVWALKDVSFDVKRGEVVGIIGRNGAGKSTLLKILSRITEPTTGSAEIRGRVGSLLEVGTGFHPELTGRENIALNGAILGMKQAEIEKKFDQIVDFSEIERFIDTPVKFYSSGMYLRLAFAVAAHLDPDILLVDEVLAVGDAAFQSKCLGKMEDVSKEGRTVLFVSHNLQAVQRLCSKAFLLDKGQVVDSGAPDYIVGTYLSTSSTNIAQLAADQSADSKVRFCRVLVEQDGVQAGDLLDNLKATRIRIEYELSETVESFLLGFDLFAADGTLLFRTYDMAAVGLTARAPGHYESTCHLPEAVFRPGSYYVEMIAGIHRVRWLSKDVIRLRLTFDGMSSSDVTFPGVLLPMGRWEVIKAHDSDLAAR